MTTQSRPPLIVLTRPQGQSLRFGEQIAGAFGQQGILVAPAMEIRALPVTAPLGRFDAVIFTSQHAARLAPGIGFALPTPAFCVGDKTAEVARQAGFDVTTLGGDADGLVAGLIAIPAKGRLLHLHGVETRGNVAGRLVGAGIATVGLAIYDQPAMPLTAAARQVLGGGDPVILPVFSPRTARIIADQGPFPAPIWVLAISPAVANACAALSPVRLEIAQSPDAAGMLAALGGILRHPRT